MIPLDYQLPPEVLRRVHDFLTYSMVPMIAPEFRGRVMRALANDGRGVIVATLHGTPDGPVLTVELRYDDGETSVLDLKASCVGIVSTGDGFYGYQPSAA